eukprot:scaffold277336_cov24-Tisochrysis_lutea.AAC.1
MKLTSAEPRKPGLVLSLRPSKALDERKGVLPALALLGAPTPWPAGTSTTQTSEMTTASAESTNT